ncbi:MAG: DoxX family protein [Jiangellaceae bacterium]
MNAFLWVLQVLLGVAFVAAGLMHAGQPRQRLLERLPWVEDFSAPTLKFIGTMELAGGLGVVLPALTGIAPILTPIAATGLAVIMLGAMATHVRRREPAGVAITGVLFALAAIVAWGRFGPYPL